MDTSATEFIYRSVESASRDHRVLAIYKRMTNGFITLLFSRGDDTITFDEYDAIGEYFVRFKDNTGEVRTVFLNAFV